MRRSSQNERAGFPRLRRGLFFLFLTISIGYLASRFSGGVAKLREAGVALDYGRLALALIFYSLMTLSYGVTAILLIRSFGYPVDLRAGLRDLLAASLGKYIPGKLGAAMLRVEVFSSRGVPVRIVLAAMVVEQGYLVLTGAALGTVAFAAARAPAAVWPALALFGLLYFVLIRSPRRVLRLVSRVFSRFGREIPAEGLPRPPAVLLLGTALAGWVFFSAATWYCVSSVPGTGQANFLDLTGRYALSTVAGFLAFFAPAGIGVREGLFVAMSASDEKTFEVICSVLLRLVSSAADVASVAALSGICLLAGRRRAATEGGGGA